MAALLLFLFGLICYANADIYTCNRIDTQFGRAYCGDDFYDLSSVWFIQWLTSGNATAGVTNANLYGTFAGMSSDYVSAIALSDQSCPNLNPLPFPAADLVAFDCYGDSSSAHQAYPVGRTTQQTWSFSNGTSGPNTMTVVFPGRDNTPNLVVAFVCDPNAPQYNLNITVTQFSAPNLWRINVMTTAVCHAVPPCGASVASSLNGPWPMFQANRARTGQTSLTGPSTCHVAWRTFVGGPVTGSPVIGPNHKIYVGTATGSLASIGPNGTPRWRASTPGPAQTAVVAMASPFFSQNISIYVPSLNQMLAFDPDSSTLVWNFTAPDPTAICSTAAFSDFNFYYTGIFFVCGRTVYSVNAVRGRVEWQFAVPAAEAYLTPPVIDMVNGTIYVGSKTTLYGLSSTGVVVFNYSSGVIGIPTLSKHGRSIFFNGVDNQTYAVSTETGFMLWSSAVSPSLSSAAIGPDCAIFFGTYDGKVLAIEGSTGFSRWEFQTGGRVDSSPAVDSTGTVYIGSYDHHLYALDGKTGHVKWSLATNSQITASPAIDEDGSIIIGTANGYVYSITGDTTAPACPSG